MTQVTYQQYQFTIDKNIDSEKKEGCTKNEDYIKINVLDLNELYEYKCDVDKYIENIT